MKADRIADPWGARMPYGRHQAWPSRVDTHLAEGVEPGAVQRWVGAASLLHSGGDAMDIAVVDGRMAGVRGRAADRVSRGRLGPKDLFGWQANASSDRLTRPLVRRDGHLVETDWDTAMELVAGRTRELLDERGPGSIRRRPGSPTSFCPPPPGARRPARSPTPTGPRDLHLAATENSLHWEMLAQTSQATRDERLLELASA